MSVQDKIQPGDKIVEKDVTNTVARARQDVANFDLLLTAIQFDQDVEAEMQEVSVDGILDMCRYTIIKGLAMLEASNIEVLAKPSSTT